MTQPQYTFGDSDIAAERLARLHALFAGSTRAFLREQTPPDARLALDLGCGPGCTTRELAACLTGCRCVGLDSSASFVAQAQRASAGPDRASFVVHDVTRVPFPMGPADLLYQRFLLTHLAEPVACVRRWATQLRRGGRLLLEETERIETGVPAFVDYLAIAEAMLRANGQLLYIGPALASADYGETLAVRCSSLARVSASRSVAAGIFARNLEAWKKIPFVQAHHAARVAGLAEEMADLAASVDPTPCIEWHLRQMAMERTEEASDH